MVNPTDISMQHSLSLREAATVVTDELKQCKSCSAYLKLRTSRATGYCCCCRNDHSENQW